MIRVNKYFLENILSPLCVFADGEEYSKDFDEIDSNNEEEIRKIIRSYLIPWFIKKEDKYKQITKDTLRYYLTTEKVDFDGFMQSRIPFKSPSIPKLFYIWLWKEYFGENEPYLIEDFNKKDYHEDNNMLELNRY